jgi:hypothetical protein
MTAVILARRHARARAPSLSRPAWPLALALATFVALPGPSSAEVAHGQDASQLGAYCPLPEKGEVPVCLTPAKAEYQDFFAALDEGKLGEAETATVESDLSSGAETERTYLALSSLSYGYFRLAEKVGKDPAADPALLARLQHWNRLLLDVYGEADAHPRLRAALRTAAVDLQSRTPQLGEACLSTHAASGCDGAHGLVRALAVIDRNAGIRSPLTSLVNRLIGDSPEASTLSRPVSGTK